MLKMRVLLIEWLVLLFAAVKNRYSSCRTKTVSNTNQISATEIIIENVWFNRIREDDLERLTLLLF
jgi:hypothetical protein